MSEIKPCPFCGGEAELCYGGRGDSKADGMSFVRCKECGTIGSKFCVSAKYCSNDLAIEAWNRRVDDEQIQRFGL